MTQEYKHLLIEHEDEYTNRRTQNKNSILVGSILFTKSAIGLGLLTNAYFFTQTGAILGSITTLVLCFLISYSMRVLLDIADRFES